MWNRFATYFLSQPKRLRAIAQALVTTGGFVLLAAVVGWAARRMLGVAQRTAPQKLPQTLAELFPGLPTWWVPETLTGALPALGLVALGLWLALVAQQYRRAGASI